MRIATGIGSREVQSPYDEWLYQIALYLADNNCILRSGGAKGADTIFQKAFTERKKPMEIYIPWAGFERNIADGVTILLPNHKECRPFTERYHPNATYLSDGAYKLMNRNAHQVLGKDLKTLSDLIVCYTKGGELIGGTSQAMRIALDKKIPIVNIGGMESYEEVLSKVKSILDKNNINDIKTSYFAKYKEPNGISICAKTPSWFTGDEYKPLAPSYDILMEYKNSTLSKEEKEYIYIRRYKTEILSKLDCESVYNDLKGRVMLCYEKSDVFCHRHIVAQWFFEKLNINILEI